MCIFYIYIHDHIRTPVRGEPTQEYVPSAIFYVCHGHGSHEQALKASLFPSAGLGTELSPGQRPAKKAVGLPIVTHCLYCFWILPNEIADKNGAGNVQTSQIHRLRFFLCHH